MRVLVTAASRHGATDEIAAALADGLQRRGVDAESHPVEQVRDLDRYDAVVLGSAVYAGHWLKAARRWAEAHADALAARPVWLFSSGPVGAPDPKPEGDPVDLPELVTLTRAEGHRVFAGALFADRLTLPERALVRALRAPYGDFRDWAAIDDFASEVYAGLALASAA